MHQPRVSGASHDAARPRRPPGRRPERHRRLVRPGSRPGRGYANLRYAEPDRVRPTWPAGPTVLLPGDRLRWSPDPPCAQGRGRGDRPTWPRVRHCLRAEILHEPRLWPEYAPDYYAVFIRDPAGNNLELKCRASTAQPTHPDTTEERAS